MIFSRKYVFETKKTRALRLALNGAVAFAGLILVYISFLLATVMTSRSEERRTQEGLYQKAPDAIVVFTGDRGRISRALAHVKKWPEAQLLISGVHGANNFRSIIAGQDDVESILNSTLQVDIDYEALDTLGNVRETLEHLGSQGVRNSRVLVVTSDYHVLRVRMIFNHHDAKLGIDVFYDGVESDWSQWQNLKKLIVESMKTLRVWFLITFN